MAERLRERRLERATGVIYRLTFGVTALATAPLRMVGQGDTGAIVLI